MIRVLVADDHPIVRAGIVGLLADADADDITVVGEAADGAEAVAQARLVQPDVVLLDLRMPVLDGVAATSQIVAAGLGRVLVLTTYESDEQILAAIGAGAAGYVLKASPSSEIVAGVRAVAEGESALSPSVAARLVHHVRTGPVKPVTTPSLLSPRELDVLRLVATGRTNAEIGRELYIGEATVKSHLLRVFAKLKVTDRTMAVIRGIEHGLIETPGG
jgi:DNA-binding NarL/FixJ family response regulator